MTELALDSNKGNYQIRSYEPGKLIINDQTYNQSVVISMTELILWQPQSFPDLKSEDFQWIADQQPEIFILGTGEKQIFPSGHLFDLLADKNIGVEVMNTAAACRTFNVLASEGRKVIAALLIH
jgi:uncharacterized protein